MSDRAPGRVSQNLEKKFITRRFKSSFKLLKRAVNLFILAPYWCMGGGSLLAGSDGTSSDPEFEKQLKIVEENLKKLGGKDRKKLKESREEAEQKEKEERITQVQESAGPYFQSDAGGST